MKVRTLVSYLFSVLVLFQSINTVEAASKHKKKAKPKESSAGVVVVDGQTFVKQVSIKLGKKKIVQNISCLNTTSGTVKKSKNKLLFLSHAKELKNLNATIKKTRDAKTRNKLTTRSKLVDALKKAGRTSCATPPTPVATPTPPSAFREYAGAWGEKEVRRLLEVFALGSASFGTVEKDVARYVQMGMKNTVADLLTDKPETPYVDNLVGTLSCDSNPDDAMQDCYKKGNINDFYLDGYIDAFNLRAMYTNNPVKKGALWLFAMDERAPANPRVLNNSNRWSYKNYMDLVDRFVMTGDAKEYVINFADSTLGHAKWLSGDSNHRGLGKAGNQDFGREIMELVSIGTRDAAGNPTYTDLDVELASRACSGLAEKTETDVNGNNINIVGFFPDLHYPGPKTLFAGTPHQVTVENCRDLAQALVTVRGDQYAYELARRLYKRFISGKDDAAAVQSLKNIIIENDFKLIPVFARMMQSAIFYSPEAAESIIKDPQTYFLTYARMVGIPIGRTRDISTNLNALGMEAGKPPTVFGFSYNKVLLTSDLFQVQRISKLYQYTFNQDFEKIKTNFNWTFFKDFVSQIPRTSGEPARDAVDAVLKRLNLADRFNQAQKDQFVQFLNYYMGNCDNNARKDCFQVGGQWKKLYRDAIDLGNEQSSFERLKLLLVMLATNREFQTN